MTGKTKETTVKPENITKLTEELEKYQKAYMESQKQSLRLEGAVVYIQQLIKEEQNGS